MSLGQNLRRCRQLAGFKSARSFALYHHISYLMYLKYENDQRKPTVNMLVKLARILNVSLDTLCDTKPMHEGEDQKDYELNHLAFYEMEAEYRMEYLKDKYENACDVVRKKHIEPPFVSIEHPVTTGTVYLSYPNMDVMEFDTRENMYDCLRSKGVTARGIFRPASRLLEKEHIKNAFENREKCLKILAQHLDFLHLGMVLVLCGPWKESSICCTELLYAMEHNVQVYQME